MNIETQTQAVRRHLESGQSITPIEALNLYGCFRLGARIYDLKREGMSIITENYKDERTGKRYARYWAQFTDTLF